MAQAHYDGVTARCARGRRLWVPVFAGGETGMTLVVVGGTPAYWIAVRTTPRCSGVALPPLSWLAGFEEAWRRTSR